MKALGCILAAGLALTACGESDDGHDADPSATGGQSGSSGAGGSQSAGSSGKGGASSSAGASGSAGQATGGSAGSGSAGSGGQATSGSAGAAGSSDDGSAGAGGAANFGAPCVIESLHIELSGGMALDYSGQPEDSCGGTIGGAEQEVSVSFIISPPGAETKPLLAFVAYDIAPGTEGSFAPEVLSVLATGAIWGKDLPAANSVACSVNLTTYDERATAQWRVVGSVTCPSPLSGIGEVGATPLTVVDWSFSLLVTTPP